MQLQSLISHLRAGTADRRITQKKTPKKLQNLTRQMRDKHPHMHVTGDNNAVTYLSSAGCSSVRGFVLVRGGKMRGCCLFFPSLPRRVYSLQPPRNLKRLNDSASTFGKRWEYVGLCSLSEILDSCRETPAAPGPPQRHTAI